MSESRPSRPMSGGRSLRSVIPTTDLGSGMVSPSTPFVAEDGTLTTVGFRFLFTLWRALSDLGAPLAFTRAEAGRLAALEARVAALEERPAAEGPQP